MIPIYRHTQPGWTILALLTAGLGMVSAVALPTGATTVILVTFVTLALAAILFASLTVSVDDASVRWHFGPGCWHHSLPLAEVTEARVIRTPEARLDQ